MMSTKQLRLAFAPIIALAALLGGIPAAAQHGGALTMEGIHESGPHSAAAAGVGGMSLMMRNNATVMFRNPAALAHLMAPQLSLGIAHRSIDRRQNQHYAPVRYYPNLSLLLEGMTDLILDPDPDAIGFTPRDTVQRPFDDLGPNWVHSQSATAPIQGFAAMPFQAAGLRFGAGIGVIEHSNPDFYYQNNNILAPDVLDQRPVPTPRPTDNDPIEVDWYQVIRSRQGSVAGYGGAVAVEWVRHNLAFGVSGNYLRGTTDDFELDQARGTLTFFSNAFRIDTLEGRVTRTGRSEFSGMDWALSSILRGRHVVLGLTYRPAMTITRSYSLDTESLMDGSSTISGQDELVIPWRGSAGLMLTPRPDLVLGLEYELRPYDRARYVDSSGGEANPWMSSSAFRIGAEYAAVPWLAIRGGMRRDAETFGARGRPLENDPVWYTAYTAGAGITVAGAQLNIAFETRNTRYEDVMGSAVHFNRDVRRMVVADLIYTFSRGR
jgi:hypothetical protein